MTFIEQLMVLERIDALINRKGTGTADNLADLLGISRRTVFNHLDTLRVLGGDIDYCCSRKSYFYVNDKRASLPTIAKSDSKKIHGGENSANFFLDVQNFCTPTLDLCSRLIADEERDDAGGFRSSGF